VSTELSRTDCQADFAFSFSAVGALELLIAATIFSPLKVKLCAFPSPIWTFDEL